MVFTQRYIFSIVAAAVLFASMAVVPSFARAQSGSCDFGETPTSSQLVQCIQELQRQLGQPQSSGSGQGVITTQSGSVAQTDRGCFSFNRNLGLGSSGEAVIQLHKALAKDGVNVPDQLLNGSRQDRTLFSRATREAVKEFQEKYQQSVLAPHNLNTGTGFVGRTTRAQLNRVYGCSTAEAARSGTLERAQRRDIHTRSYTGQPTLNITHPQVGDQFEPGDEVTLRWEAQNFDPSDQRVWLYDPENGSQLIRHVSNDTRFLSYSVGENADRANGYQFGVCDHASPRRCDWSGRFSIVDDVDESAPEPQSSSESIEFDVRTGKDAVASGDHVAFYMSAPEKEDVRYTIEVQCPEGVTANMKATLCNEETGITEHVAGNSSYDWPLAPVENTSGESQYVTAVFREYEDGNTSRQKEEKVLVRAEHSDTEQGDVDASLTPDEQTAEFLTNNKSRAEAEFAVTLPENVERASVYPQCPEGVRDGVLKVWGEGECNTWTDLPIDQTEFTMVWDAENVSDTTKQVTMRMDVYTSEGAEAAQSASAEVRMPPPRDTSSDEGGTTEASITVSSPSSGDTYTRGNSYTAEWTAEGIKDGSDRVTWLYHPDSGYTQPNDVFDDAANEFTISSDVAADSGYQLLVCGYDTTAEEQKCGRSDSFEVVEAQQTSSSSSGDADEPRVTVLNSTQAWSPGAQKTITWEGFSAEKVYVFLNKNGSYDDSIAWKVDDTGSVSWTVPSGLETNANYQIEVRGHNTGEIDVSDGYFYISSTGSADPLTQLGDALSGLENALRSYVE